MIRLQKYLANSGIASRRQCEQFIINGQVKVNGKVVTKLGTRINPLIDKVRINNEKILYIKPKFRTIMLNKPRGYVCTASKYEGKTVYDIIRKDIKEKVVSVGRLDKNSEGLLLLSNDGRLIQKLTHPSNEYRKIYHVMVSGEITPESLEILNSRMMIDDYQIREAEVKLIRPGQKHGRFLLQFTLKEGRKRQIRSMCENVKLQVHRLVRVQIKSLKMGGLKSGEWRDLTKEEITSLSSS